MSDFSVTIDQLRVISEQLSEMNAQFNAQRNQLAETAASLNGMWEGEAKERFSAEVARDQIQMQNFYNAIAQYVNALNQIIAKYLEAETRNLDTASTRVY